MKADQRGQVCRSWAQFIKRFIDVVVSLMGLVLLTPMILAISVAIKMGSRGAVIFSQERSGKHGQLFVMYKFRTMKVGAVNGEVKVGDSRLTQVGRWLRFASLDEVPQLVNVLKGDMSLIGPRPDRSFHVIEYSPRVSRRLDMKPGIMGIAQLHNGRSLSWEERYEYDLEYVDNFSIWLDFRILCLSFCLFKMFQREGSE